MGYVYQIDKKDVAWTARTYQMAGFSEETDGDIVSRLEIQNGTATAVAYNEAKQNLMKAQSDELQAKYEYIFRTKILDFYKGVEIN